MKANITSYFFFALLLGVAILSIIIFLPFLTPIILAVAFAVIVHPLYKAIIRAFGTWRFRNGISAFITVCIVVIVVFVPLFLVLAKIYSEIQSLYALLVDESGRSQVITSLNYLSKSVSGIFFGLFPAYSFDTLNITEYLKGALEWLFANIDTIFSGFTKVAGYLFVFILSLFYFLRDGENLKKKFISWSPLLDNHDEYIVMTLKRAVKSVFAGTIVVCIIQGFLTGIGFWIFGIPAPVIWGSVAAVGALIPAIGTSLVLVPGVIYLVITGSYPFAIGLAVWGLVAVGLIDNILGPFLVNKGMNIHPFLILISVLGGLAVFGIVGFVLGPLILASLFALLDIYKKSFA